MVDCSLVYPPGLGYVHLAELCLKFALLLPQASSGPSYGSVADARAATSEGKASLAGSVGEHGQAANVEAGSSSQGVISETEDGRVERANEGKVLEAALPPALELTPQAKGKPIVELSAEEANDMTCAICLDQIPVPELCAIKGCDHVYCGMWLPSLYCSWLVNRYLRSW